MLIKRMQTNYKWLGKNILPDYIDRVIITDPYTPTVEVQSILGIRKYYKKLSKLSNSELCREFSNVMSAKHNKMFMGSGLGNYEENQRIVTDLTDKALCICMFKFGRKAIIRYAGNDLTKVNRLINNVDTRVAQKELDVYEHGSALFRELAYYFG